MEYWRSRVASRGPTYVAKGKTTRGPGQWLPNDKCVIDRLRVQSWINVTKQDWGDWINPTMNGGGHLLLIWGRTWRTLLEYKVKPLSGDKGTRTDDHNPKIQQGRMARVWTNAYLLRIFYNCIWMRSKRYMNHPSEERIKDCSGAIGSLILVVG